MNDNKLYYTELEEKISKLEAELFFYKNLANNTYDWQTFRDKNGKLILSSDAMERITGYKNEDYLSGRKVMKELIHPDDYDKVYAEIKRAMNEEIIDGCDYRVVKPDQSITFVNANAVPIYNIDNEFIGFRISVRDISKQKQLELQVKSQNEELLALNKTKDKFISIIGHDLISPFHSLLSFAELLYNEYDDFDAKSIKEMITHIYNTTKNTYSLVDNLFQWVRSKQGAMPFNPEIIDMQLLIQETINLFTGVAKIKQIELVNENNASVKVKADIEQMRTILRNMVSNAIKFSNKEGIITISVSEANGQIAISVTDNGVGISENDLKTLFNKNELKNMKGTAGERGSGLGLQLCNEFLENHGTKLTIESKLGTGSTFSFTLEKNS